MTSKDTDHAQRLYAMTLFRMDFPTGPLPIDPPKPAMEWATRFLRAMNAVIDDRELEQKK